ncbi:MAG: DUF86 domain-containing protein [Methanosarcinales archaeon]|nr:DUF86 domain-containing protein [Methanosarcinales archaeon]
MFDLERLTKIISDIHRYLDDLERIEIKDPRDLDDIRNFYAVSMILFTLINRVIDLGDEIVTSRNLGVPGTYREIFNLLERGKVIDKELASDLSNLVYQRNILAHEYHNLTEEDVFRTYRRVPVIRKFVERVKENIKDV